MKQVDYISLKATRNASFPSGWDTRKAHLLPLFLVLLVIAVSDIPLELSAETKLDKTAFIIFLQVLGISYWLLFAPIICYSANLLFIQAVRNEPLELKNIIIGFNNYLNIVLTNLLVTALIGTALVALIIPGIIVACRLVFVSYLVMDKRLDPISVVEEIWRMTIGYNWRVFSLGVTSVFIFFFDLLLVIVGTIPAVIWIKASFASLTKQYLNEKQDNLRQ